MAGRAAIVAGGQLCSRTTAPSPWASAPSTTSRSSSSGVRSGRQSSGSTSQWVSVSRPLDSGEDARVVVAGAERAAKPRPRVGSGELPDRLLRLAQVLLDAAVGEQRHRRVVMGVVADQVAGGGDPAGHSG